MQQGRLTRSKTKSQNSQPITLTSSSSQPHCIHPPIPTPPHPQPAQVFNCWTPILTPSNMSEQPHRDTPPHQQAQGLNPPLTNATAEPTPAPQPPPVIDPALQVAMAALVATMMQQFQIQAVNNQPINQPQPEPAPQSCVKTCDPDTYDGTDPTKLCSFLSQCKLVFWSWPHKFRDDHIKIMYTVSWLKGTTQHWYEPNLSLDEFNLPLHALYWDAFEAALHSTFGEPDPIASAMHKLDNLIMKDYHHLNKYNIEFNEYTTITGFNECALYAKYYKGLAPRIKDSLVYSSHPATLARLQEQAQELDLRHWEWKDEEKYQPSVPKASSSASWSSGTSSAMSTYPSLKSSASKNSRSSTLSSSTASSSMPKTSDLSKVLGPDGKLLPKEKECHCKNNLCLMCGSKEHFVNKCPNCQDSTHSRAANLASINEEGSHSEPESLPSEAESSESPNWSPVPLTCQLSVVCLPSGTRHPSRK